MVAQDFADEGFGVGPNAGGLGSAVGRGGHQIGQLFRRVVAKIRSPGSGAQGTGMGFDQLLVQKDADQLAAASGPHLPADKAGRQGVVGAVKDDMVIGMDRAFLPERTLKGLRGKRFQTSRLFALEDFKGAPFRRSMNLPADFLPAPDHGPLIRLVDVLEGPARQQVLTHDRYVSFHFPFMPSQAHLGGVGHKPVVAFQFRVGPIQDRIVNIGFEHARFQIIQNDRGRHALKELKSPDVAIDPGGRILAEDKAHEAMAAVGKRHSKRPRSRAAGH
jgi:hypothetical protein